MQCSPYLMSLIRKFTDDRDSLYPEELELLEEAGFFDADEFEDTPYDTPSLQDRGLYLGSYES